MTINAIEELEKRGYVFSLTKNGLKYKNSANYSGDDKRQFLDRIMANKAAAIQFLKNRQPDELVQLEQLHDWLVEHRARITGRSWLDSHGVLTVHVEEIC